MRFACLKELSKSLAAEVAHHPHIANGVVQDGRHHVFGDGNFVLKDIAHDALGWYSLELDGVGARTGQVYEARHITLGLILAVAQRDHCIDRLLPGAGRNEAMRNIQKMRQPRLLASRDAEHDYR